MFHYDKQRVSRKKTIKFSREFTNHVTSEQMSAIGKAIERYTQSNSHVVRAKYLLVIWHLVTVNRQFVSV